MGDEGRNGGWVMREGWWVGDEGKDGGWVMRGGMVGG